jgi:TetR/AcrR family transcriptional regulator, transcriptional repressor for nem operon
VTHASRLVAQAAPSVASGCERESWPRGQFALYVTPNQSADVANRKINWESRAVILSVVPRPANPEVRASLIAAGERLIHRRGFNGSGVKDVAAAAGVPKGSFYNYFPSKDAFVVAVVEEYWRSIEVRYGSILKDTTLAPRDRVIGFFRAMADDNELRDFTLGCLLGNMALELADGSPQMRGKLAELFARWETALAEALRDGQAQGEVAADRDVLELAATLVEAWEGAVMRGKIDQGRAAYERFESVVVPRLIG